MRDESDNALAFNTSPTSAWSSENDFVECDLRFLHHDVFITHLKSIYTVK